MTRTTASATTASATTASARGRRRAARFGRPILALGAAGAVALLLAQNTAGAAFTGQTGNGADQVSSAASFCTSPGSTTLTPSADDATYQGGNASHNYGTNTSLGTISGVNTNAWSFLRFPLPTLGAYCTVTAATLKLYVNTPPTSTRTLDAFRVDPTAPLWTETGLYWNNQPTGTGTAAPATSPLVAGWMQWTVFTQVAAIYTSGVNNGLVVEDATQSSSTTMTVYFDSREATNKPQLLLTWG